MSNTSELAVLVFGQQEPPGLCEQSGVVGSGLHVALDLDVHRHQHLNIRKGKVAVPVLSERE